MVRPVLQSLPLIAMMVVGTLSFREHTKWDVMAMHLLKLPLMALFMGAVASSAFYVTVLLQGRRLTQRLCLGGSAMAVVFFTAYYTHAYYGKYVVVSEEFLRAAEAAEPYRLEHQRLEQERDRIHRDPALAREYHAYLQDIIKKTDLAQKRWALMVRRMNAVHLNTNDVNYTFQGMPYQRFRRQYYHNSQTIWQAHRSYMNFERAMIYFPTLKRHSDIRNVFRPPKQGFGAKSKWYLVEALFCVAGAYLLGRFLARWQRGHWSLAPVIPLTESLSTGTEEAVFPSPAGETDPHRMPRVRHSPPPVPETHHPCRQCGQPLKPGRAFCGKCGARQDATPPP